MQNVQITPTLQPPLIIHSVTRQCPPPAASGSCRSCRPPASQEEPCDLRDLSTTRLKHQKHRRKRSHPAANPGHQCHHSENVKCIHYHVNFWQVRVKMYQWHPDGSTWGMQRYLTLKRQRITLNISQKLDVLLIAFWNPSEGHLTLKDRKTSDKSTKTNAKRSMLSSWLSHCLNYPAVPEGDVITTPKFTPDTSLLPTEFSSPDLVQGHYLYVSRCQLETIETLRTCS